MKQATQFFKRLAALALTGVLAGSALTGCGNAASGEKTDAGSQKTEDSKEENQKEEEIVELIWYVGGGGPQADTDAVLEEANAYLKDKLNCTLKIVETDFGSYDQKMQMVIGSQEKFDLCYTANWSNNFYNNVNKNAFLELNDLIDEYAPDLKAIMPEAGWGAATVKGNIYAVPNMQIWTMTNCLVIAKEYVDEYNFDITAVKNLKDVEPLLEAIKKDNPEM